MTVPAIAVVDAQTPGNVGTIARAMKNFGFTDLLLIDPPPLDPMGEAYGFAGQARDDVLPAAREITFDALVESYHTVGFTAITGENATGHVRYPVATPTELGDDLARTDEPVALVFGREDVGLTNEELARIDRVCTIPADPDYPVLNLGQAATIACYELRELALADDHLPDLTRDRADPAAVERLHERFADLLVTIGHPEEKRPKTQRLFRRLIGRTTLTDREAITLTGVFRRAAMRDRNGSDRE